MLNINFKNLYSLFPNSYTFLNKLNAPNSNLFIEEFNNLCKSYETKNTISNFIDLQTKQIKWNSFIHKVLDIYIKIAEREWEEKNLYKSKARIRQRKIYVGKSKIYNEAIKLLGEPTRVISTILEIPNQDNIEKYREKYNLKIPKQLGFKYISGKIFIL
jgi:hypothetical protein